MPQPRLAIAYRVYGNNPRRPFSIIQQYATSFAKCLTKGGIDAKVWVVLDDCSKEYGAFFMELFGATRCVLLEGSFGNALSFNICYTRLTTQSWSEYVMFCEDDYLYHDPGIIRRCLDFMTTFDGVEFMSPFKHMDIYANKELHASFDPIVCRDFQTALSTTLTFLSTKQELVNWMHVFTKGGTRDLARWLMITKPRCLFNARYWIRWMFKSRESRFWLRSIMYALFEYRIDRWHFSKLWIPTDPDVCEHDCLGV